MDVESETHRKLSIMDMINVQKSTDVQYNEEILPDKISLGKNKKIKALSNDFE